MRDFVPYFEDKEEDLIFALLAALAKQGATRFSGEKFEDAFGSALKALGKEELFPCDIVSGRRDDFSRAIYNAQYYGFCHWKMPDFKWLEIDMVPSVVRKILARTENVEEIEKAAEAWRKKYNEIRA